MCSFHQLHWGNDHWLCPSAGTLIRGISTSILIQFTFEHLKWKFKRPEERAFWAKSFFCIGQCDKQMIDLLFSDLLKDNIQIVWLNFFSTVNGSELSKITLFLCDTFLVCIRVGDTFYNVFDWLRFVVNFNYFNIVHVSDDQSNF